MTRICCLMMINRRRIVRWQRRLKEEEQLKNLTPGPKHPPHTLLPAERTAVLQMAKSDEYADLSHRILTVTGWDLGLFFVSFSSVYRIMRSVGLTGIRGNQRRHNGRSLPPMGACAKSRH